MKQRDANELFRAKLQSLLNKLTVDKFDTLSPRLLELLKEATTLEQLEDAVVMFHKKVLADEKFTSMYTALTFLLNRDLPPVVTPGSPKPKSFRALLLNCCQARPRGVHGMY